MTREEMDACLERAKEKRQIIVRLTERRDELKNGLLAKGISYDGASVRTSPSDRMIETMAEISEIEEQIAAEENSEDVRTVAAGIDEVSNGNYRTLLTAYYLFGVNLYKLSQLTGHDYGKIKQWYRRGIDQMYEAYYKNK
ncbi:MAG: hypothetical protein Q4B15_08495 [Lachnospiraceae bacterium]|nr:hypothetical protein [Lachnospiraceae bacterium]